MVKKLFFFFDGEFLKMIEKFLIFKQILSGGGGIVSFLFLKQGV